MQSIPKYPLIEEKVTGYTSPKMAAAIYAGSTTWFLLLVAADAAYAATGAHPELYGMILTGNTFMFILQTINVWRTMFMLWPVVALYYTLQLWVIALRGTILSVNSPDDIWPHALLLLAQCLFTGSQLSVTLEYLHRVTYRVGHAISTASTLPPTRAMLRLSERV